MRAWLVIRRSRVCGSSPAPFFHWDWSWIRFYSHSLPSADSRREVVSYLQKNVYWVLVNHLVGLSLPRKSDHSWWLWTSSNNTDPTGILYLFFYVYRGFSELVVIILQNILTNNFTFEHRQKLKRLILYNILIIHAIVFDIIRAAAANNNLFFVIL